MKKFIGAMIMSAGVIMAGCDSSAKDTAKNGDTVIIDFAGFLGDEQFAGGTATNYPLQLGSHTFVPGFEEQLVGAKIGENRDVKITFPQQYVPELAGKDVVFKVTIKDIVKE